MKKKKYFVEIQQGDWNDCFNTPIFYFSNSKKKDIDSKKEEQKLLSHFGLDSDYTSGCGGFYLNEAANILDLVEKFNLNWDEKYVEANLKHNESLEEIAETSFYGWFEL